MAMDGVLELLAKQHGSLGGQLRRTVDNMTEEQFARVPGETAPPMGWHLWHIARWGDRFQATLANRESPSEIWVTDGMADACSLDPAELGVLQLGMGMEASKAQLLPAAIGKERFAGYLYRVIDALGAAIAGCDPETLMAPRLSIREYGMVNGVLQYAPAQESTLFADVMFHLTHSSRHLGSVEALRGL
jgi:hypothetical protein